MLTHIYIRDLATIEELNLNLLLGNTMITGETGAGKSVFIEAIELALGGRASSNLIRSQKEKAEISLSFDVTHFPNVIHRLKELELWQDTAECLLRRVITSDGRSKCYINGVPQPLLIVKEFGEMLFHLHSQHEQQVLLKADTQREMLDRYGSHLELVHEVHMLANEWRQVNQHLQQLHNTLHERASRCDYLRFQLQELDQLNLKTSEWETLEAEHHRLTHVDDILRHVQLAQEILSDTNQQNLPFFLKEVRKSFDAINNLEPKAIEWQEMLESAHIQLNELHSDLCAYLEKQETDPEKLHKLESRMSLIYSASRKHKIAPHELPMYHEQLTRELSELDSEDQGISELEKNAERIKSAYQVKAQQLSESRQRAAAALQKNVTATIRSLSLPHGEFRISLEPDHELLSSHGLEKINFIIKTNPDQPLQALHKVISGGELSRLSLGMHLALAHRTSIPTLIFDEVDTGLSGATAEKIGKLLRQLGETYQVFCITHQPQVAACGHHHLLVEKSVDQGTTHTTLRLLNHEERSREIARMLGGEKITAKTLAHAKEVLEGV